LATAGGVGLLIGARGAVSGETTVDRLIGVDTAGIVSTLVDELLFVGNEIVELGGGPTTGALVPLPPKTLLKKPGRVAVLFIGAIGGSGLTLISYIGSGGKASGSSIISSLILLTLLTDFVDLRRSTLDEFALPDSTV